MVIYLNFPIGQKSKSIKVIKEKEIKVDNFPPKAVKLIFFSPKIACSVEALHRGFELSYCIFHFSNEISKSKRTMNVTD